MRPMAGVKGISREERTLVRALGQLQQHGYQNVKTFSPIPTDELLVDSERRESPICIYLHQKQRLSADWQRRQEFCFRLRSKQRSGSTFDR